MDLQQQQIATWIKAVYLDDVYDLITWLALELITSFHHLISSDKKINWQTNFLG